MATNALDFERSLRGDAVESVSVVEQGWGDQEGLYLFPLVVVVDFVIVFATRARCGYTYGMHGSSEPQSRGDWPVKEGFRDLADGRTATTASQNPSYGAKARANHGAPRMFLSCAEHLPTTRFAFDGRSCSSLV